MRSACHPLRLSLLLALAGPLAAGAAPAVFNARHDWPDGRESTDARVIRRTAFAAVDTPLDPAAAARLVGDRSLQRVYRTGPRTLPRTRFTLGLNHTGWGVQIECGEPDAERLREQAPYAGELVEIFFAPSAQGPVYHLVADLAERRLAEIRLLEAGPGPRALTTGAWISGDDGSHRFLKANVAVLKEEWRIAFEVPFSVLGVDSPVERPEPWRFNIIRWLPGSTAGAVVWRGEPGDPAGWGEIRWAPPDEMRTMAVRRRVVETVWSRYHADTTEAMVHWQNRGIDPGFFTASVLPVITNNYDCEVRVGNRQQLVSLEPRKEEPANADLQLELSDPVDEARRLVDILFRRVPGWLDFPGRCDRLRRDVLLDRFCGPAERAADPARGMPARYYAVPPFSALPRLPGAPPEDGVPTPSLRLVATPGECEAASFVVEAADTVAGLAFTPAALADGARTLPAEQIDLRIVKCWYQGATAWQSGAGGADGRRLIPELLLRDDSLVQADPNRQTNLRRTEKGVLDLSDPLPQGPGELPVADAATLRPVAIRRGESRQFWLTVKVPAGQPPGLYRGEIAVRADGRAWPPLRLAVRVLPFSLPPPESYVRPGSAYLTALGGGGDLATAGGATVRARTEAQLLVEFRNRREHNELHPLFSDPACPEETFRTLVRLRREAGLAIRPILGLGYACPVDPGDPTGAAHFAETAIHPLLRLVNEVCGHRELYLVGRDAAGEDLSRQRAWWEAALDTGARIMTWGWDGHYRAMGDLIDLHARRGAPDRMQALSWHRSGGRVVQGGDPVGGLENPERSRRSFGFLAYQACYDGVVGERYWDERPWEEFDPSRNRPRNMVYPTIDGVIDTLAWEGFREGIDDIRYATLLKRMAWSVLGQIRAPAHARAREALHLLELMDARSANLDTLRLELVAAILDLQALGPQASAAGDFAPSPGGP